MSTIENSQSKADTKKIREREGGREGGRGREDPKIFTRSGWDRYVLLVQWDLSYYKVKNFFVFTNEETIISERDELSK